MNDHKYIGDAIDDLSNSLRRDIENAGLDVNIVILIMKDLWNELQNIKTMEKMNYDSKAVVKEKENGDDTDKR